MSKRDTVARCSLIFARKVHFSENSSVRGGGEAGAASWGGGAVDGGSVNAVLAAALTRVMRAAVPISAVSSASVLHSAAVVGSVVGVVGPL